MRLSNEVEDGKLLISVASFCFTESHHHFPRCVHADLGDFTVEGVKFAQVGYEGRQKPHIHDVGTSTAWT